MNYKRKYQIYYVFIFLILSFSCANQAYLKIGKTGDIIQLNKSFGVESHIGSSAVLIDRFEGVNRLALVPDEDPDEYILLFETSYIKSDIEIPKIKPSNEYSISSSSYRYIDLLLRAHRNILRKNVDYAESTLNFLDNHYDVTYGSSVLRAQIALIKGDKQKAYALLKQAKNIYGEAEWISSAFK